MLDQTRVHVLLNTYQRQSVDALGLAKLAHDRAFDGRATLEDNIAAHVQAGEALVRAHAALATLRDYVCRSDPDAPPDDSGLAAPLLLPN